MRRTAFAVVVVLALLTPAGCVMHKTSKATFCKELRRTPSLAEVFGSLATDNPSTLRTKARRTAQQFTKLQRAAPTDIRSSVSEVANLANKIATAVEGAPNNPQAIAKALRAEAGDMLSPTKAALKLASYSISTCHYDLNNPAGTTLPTVIPSTALVPTTR